MSKNAKYLICYDIRDPRRLRQVHKCVCNYAAALQLSVFYGELSAQELDQMVNDLENLIDNRCDDIRIYRVPSITKAALIGNNAIGKVMTDSLLLVS